MTHDLDGTSHPALRNGRSERPKILLRSIILVGRTIMRREFIGREGELAELEKRWRSGQPELFIVYGRRRVGKTELLLQFSRRGDKKTLYFLASQVTRQEHLRQLTEVMRETFREPLLESLTFMGYHLHLPR